MMTHPARQAPLDSMPAGGRRTGGALAALAAAVLVLTGVATAGAAQVAGDWWAGAPVATDGLGGGRWAQMEMLYERTFLRVDVLRLSMRFDAATAEQFERDIGGRGHSASVERSVVDTILAADHVLVRSRFLREISLDQFLDGIRENLADAQAADLLSDAERREIIGGVEISYEPLRATGLRAGDTLWYRIRGNALHIVFQDVDGHRVVDQRVEGPQHRRAVLGGYLSPGSDFREPLVRSLIEGLAR